MFFFKLIQVHLLMSELYINNLLVKSAVPFSASVRINARFSAEHTSFVNFKWYITDNILPFSYFLPFCVLFSWSGKWKWNSVTRVGVDRLKENRSGREENLQISEYTLRK